MTGVHSRSKPVQASIREWKDVSRATLAQNRTSRCSECKREPREDENPDDEWRVESDGVGELHIFCPECWEREFGERQA